MPQANEPSDATQARLEAKMVLAPFVTNLSSWHQQAARLLLELDRAEGRGLHDQALAQAVRSLIETVRREHAAFADETASVRSSRIEDVERSFSRLLGDLQRAEARSAA